MQFSKSLLLLAALTTGTLARPQGFERRQASATTSSVPSSSSSAAGGSWSSTPSSGQYSTSGFGSQTSSSGDGVTYAGNVGNPYGSNIIQVSESDASQYQYVAQFNGPSSGAWTVAIWNKIGPDGQMDGWFGHAVQTFTVSAGEATYVAFDSDSQGGWAAAPGSIPTDSNGGYASTWGEFDFGSTTNGGWSGFDVSAIAAQNAGLEVQGMQICDVLSNSCSSLTENAGSVDNAYTTAQTDVGGIGGNISGGPVRLAVVLDYSG
jgi:hypothetical protein